MCIRDSRYMMVEAFSQIDTAQIDPLLSITTPVSYTHLDVYKRQVHPEERDPGAPELAPLEGQEARPKGFDVDDLPPRSIPAQVSPGSQRRSAEGFVNRIVAVSYTHLDVYKRQGYRPFCREGVEQENQGSTPQSRTSSR